MGGVVIETESEKIRKKERKAAIERMIRAGATKEQIISCGYTEEEYEEVAILSKDEKAKAEDTSEDASRYFGSLGIQVDGMEIQRNMRNLEKCEEGREKHMGGMNEYGALCFADGWKAAGGNETELTVALMKEFDLDEQTAKWHAAHAFQSEATSKENMLMPNEQAENEKEMDHFYSKENQEWLRHSMRQLEEGHMVTHDLIEADAIEDDEPLRDYTIWQREHFDKVDSGIFYADALEYAKTNPFLHKEN